MRKERVNGSDGEWDWKGLRLTPADIGVKEAPVQTVVQQAEAGGQARELGPQFWRGQSRTGYGESIHSKTL